MKETSTLMGHCPAIGGESICCVLNVFVLFCAIADSHYLARLASFHSNRRNDGFALGPYTAESEVCFNFSASTNMNNGARFVDGSIVNGDYVVTQLASGAELESTTFCLKVPAVPTE